MPRDCEAGGLWIVNTKKKLAKFIPNISNCDIEEEEDLDKYLIDIAPVNGFVFITKDYGKLKLVALSYLNAAF